ncbi:MAG: UPF0175 family protein [Desulfobacterales bacterium]
MSEDAAAEKMLHLSVLGVYKHKQLSSGKAAELPGIRKYDFIRMMADEGMDYFDYSPKELEEEFKAIDRWKKQMDTLNANQKWI